MRDWMRSMVDPEDKEMLEIMEAMEDPDEDRGEDDSGREGAKTGDPRRKKSRRLALSGNMLKGIGCLFLLCLNFSRIVIQNGWMKIGSYSSAQLVEALQQDPGLAKLSTWASVLQLVGHLAIPLFAFLLAEGYIHTKSFRRYLTSLLVLAVVSEIPYDWAVHGSLMDWTSQNVVFSSVIALVGLYGLAQLEERKGILPRMGQLLILAAAVVWCSIARCSYGAGTVLLTGVYYLFRRRNMGRLLMGCAVSMMYYTAPLASFFLWAYSGERGRGPGRRFWYLLYPAQLVLLGGLARLG